MEWSDNLFVLKRNSDKPSDLFQDKLQLEKAKSVNFEKVTFMRGKGDSIVGAHILPSFNS